MPSVLNSQCSLILLEIITAVTFLQDFGWWRIICCVILLCSCCFTALTSLEWTHQITGKSRGGGKNNRNVGQGHRFRWLSKFLLPFYPTILQQESSGGISKNDCCIQVLHFHVLSIKYYSFLHSQWRSISGRQHLVWSQRALAPHRLNPNLEDAGVPLKCC